MKVEFSVRAHSLKNMAGALRGQSDPYAVVTQISTSGSAAPIVLGKTETIENTLSPEWCRVFVVDYELGKPMKLVVSIFDEQSNNSNKNSMGSAVFDVAELLGARGNTKAKRVKQGGTVFAHVRKYQGSGLLRLQMKGVGLKNTDGMFRKSDPFFELSRQLSAAGAQTWDNVYRSKPVQDSLDPVWKDTAIVDLATLCGGNLDAPIKISVYDYESSGKHVLMGAFETTIDGLRQAYKSNKSIALTDKGKETGQIVLTKVTVAGVEEEEDDDDDKVTDRIAAVSLQDRSSAVVSSNNKQPTFLDYITGGCQLHLIVAVDFTGSNGDPRKPGTLHHIDDNSSNQYEKAISAIVEILAKYDSDQKFPVLGFGAKYNGVVQHCFQVGGCEECQGVHGVLEAYRSVFKTGLIMSSPTVFTEVMQTAAARAQSALEAAQRNGRQAYTILLILTDGAVSDVKETVECLRQISDSPLSVVIVGVGDADFGEMEFLDDHNAPSGSRDLAQFVHFNKHAHSPDDLTSVTLREIPKQLTEYFQSKNIQPNAPIIVTDEAEIVVEEEEEEIDLSLDVIEDEIVVTGGGCQARSW